MCTQCLLRLNIIYIFNVIKRINLFSFYVTDTIYYVKRFYRFYCVNIYSYNDPLYKGLRTDIFPSSPPYYVYVKLYVFSTLKCKPYKWTTVHKRKYG